MARWTLSRVDQALHNRVFRRAGALPGGGWSLHSVGPRHQLSAYSLVPHGRTHTRRIRNGDSSAAPLLPRR